MVVLVKTTHSQGTEMMASIYSCLSFSESSLSFLLLVLNPYREPEEVSINYRKPLSLMVSLCEFSFILFVALSSVLCVRYVYYCLRKQLIASELYYGFLFTDGQFRMHGRFDTTFLNAPKYMETMDK